MILNAQSCPYAYQADPMVDRKSQDILALEAELAALRLRYNEEKRLIQDQANMNESANNKELQRAQEQLKAHSQTIGSLIAEKTHLQARLSHYENLSQTQLREIEELKRYEANLTDRVHEAEILLEERRSEMEQNTILIHSSDQIDQLQRNLKNEQLLRQELQSELNELRTRHANLQQENEQLNVLARSLRNKVSKSSKSSSDNQDIDSNTNGDSESFSIISGADSCRSYDHLMEDRILMNEEIVRIQSELASALNEKDVMEKDFRNFAQQLEKRQQESFDALNVQRQQTLDAQFLIENLRQELMEKESALEQIKQEGNRTELPEVTSNNQSHAEKKLVLENQGSRRVEELLLLNSSQANEMSCLKDQIHSLTDQLRDHETLLEDHLSIVSQSESLRVNSSRLVEQNNYMKDQLAQLIAENRELSEKLAQQVSIEPHVEEFQSKAAIENDIEKVAELTEALQVADTKIKTLQVEKDYYERTSAQLEMEASTVEEYITMFTHRRCCEQRRAKLRESILSSLLADRRETQNNMIKVVSTFLSNDTEGNYA
ncbi:golgin subfamily A [Cichlidogyrus casuarinus]|uniref:Golgin subfamily A n=1 Tax=Cichlidogyrus casuarinus TaxID=1844966 RepID=A0ABD2QGS8_9PLAT